MLATSSPVLIPSQALRRPVASARCPRTGASTATRTPASAMPQPRLLVRCAIAASYSALPSPKGTNSGSMKLSDVRYSAVKTNVMITELKGCVAQSHSAHAATRDRGMSESTPAGGIASLTEGRSVGSAPLLMGTVCPVMVNEWWRTVLHRRVLPDTLRLWAHLPHAGFRTS